MMPPRHAGVALLLTTAMCAAGAVGCGKKGDGPSDPGAPPAPSAPPSASAAAAPQGPTTWAGRYEASPGVLYVPDGGEWSGVKFRGDDAAAGLGPGAMTLHVDPSSGRIDGTADGPLGPLVVAGSLDGATVRLRFTPAGDAGAEGTAGFTGVGLGTRTGDAIAGAMSLSLPTGNVLRRASFSLEKK